MVRPRVILADTDESYIAPLETKFLRELSDGINLEIVTDRNYLASLFSAPQNADVLIISEQLYDSTFEKHNISHTFVLTEDSKNCRNLGGTVAVIFKYSSVKEIFSHVISVCKNAAEQKNDGTGETKIIMLYSVQGGVGKTVLALGLSACMANSYKKVLYINAVRLNTFHFMLTDKSPIPVSAAAGLRPDYSNAYEVLQRYIRNEHFHYLPPFSAALSTLDIEYSVYREFIRSAKQSRDYEYIIVDADPVLDADKSAMLAQADKVLIVTDQTEGSVFATNLIGRNMNCSDSEKFFYICNKYCKNEFNANEKAADLFFQINEYVEYNKDMQSLLPEQLGQLFDIQKITFLVV